MKTLFRYLLAAAFVGALTFPAQAQFESKPTPLWEGVEKTEADKKNDLDFVEKALQLTDGNRLQAAIAITRIGWTRIGEGDPNDAIRRFNQAWLVEPALPDIYWGLGVATHIRGDETKDVERWFDEAAKGIKDNPRFLADRGRVLDERKLPKRARFWFEAALALNPDYLPAHIGMTRVAIALEDKALEEKHRERMEALQESQTQ